MTPKEKAKELIDYFEKAMMDADMYGDYSKATKKCALIAVDEILDLGYVPNEKSKFNIYKFYSVVKLEIELL